MGACSRSLFRREERRVVLGAVGLSALYMPYLVGRAWACPRLLSLLALLVFFPSACASQALFRCDDPGLDYLEECIARQEPYARVLRLMCLYSQVSGKEGREG